MSGISSIGGSASAASYSPLDKNQDGVVDAQELQEAAQSGLLSASILDDEDSSDTSSPTDAFSGNLASMLLQMQQNTASGSSTGTSSSSDGSSSQSQSQSQSPMDALFASLDSNGDGKVSADEFVAGRPKDMSESAAEKLFKTLDTQSSGSLDEDQFSEGLNVLQSSDTSAADMLSLEQTSSNGSDSSSNGTGTGSSDSQNTLQSFLAEMQASMTAYQNSYGQYDVGSSDSVDGVAA